MFRWLSLIVFSIVMLSTGITPLHAGEGKSKRVMILPFDGTSSGDFAYLVDSVRAMVSSRLAANREVELVDYSVHAESIRSLKNGQATLASGESLFSRFQIDYIVSGGLYALQTGLQVQVQVLGKTEGAQPVDLQVLAVNEDAIIPQMELLAEEIAGKGMEIRSATTPVVASASEQNRQGLSGFATEHPEKAYKKGIFSGSIVSGEGAMSVTSTGVRRSSMIPSMLVTMAAGNLVGDEGYEIVSAGRRDIIVYQFNETRFVQLAEYKFSGDYKIHAVNLADLDNDGRVEIFISADRGERAASAIMRFENGELKPVLKDIEWFLRPLTEPGGNLILAGQRSSTDPRQGYVGRGISQLMIYDNYAGVREEKRLPLPAAANLFDFEWVDLDNDGAVELVRVDKREKLLVYDSTNSLIWVSEGDYGGSRNFIGPPKSSAVRQIMSRNNESQFERDYVFIPTRILAVDVNGDGSRELIVGRNQRMYGSWAKWMSNTREYDGGEVVCLGWSDGSLQELWRTNKLNGYIADYKYVRQGNRFGDDNDMSAGLYVAQVPEKMFFGFVMKSESKLLRYDLDIQQGE